MQRIKIILRKDLNDEEKQEIRKRFQGQYFCLNEMIENGFVTYYYNLSGLKSRWSKYACDFVEINE